MTFCVSTGVRTWTNWLTFERDPDRSPDARIGLLSAISYALQRGILLHRENPRGMVIGRPSQQRRVVLRRRNTVVGGKCALPGALLVCRCRNKSQNVRDKLMFTI